IAERREVDQPHPVRKTLLDVTAHLEGQPRFARTARPGQGDEAVICQQGPHLTTFTIASDEGRHFRRQVVRHLSPGAKWRKDGLALRMQQLKDLLRYREIAKAMRTQVQQRRTHWEVRTDQCLRGLA